MVKYQSYLFGSLVCADNQVPFLHSSQNKVLPITPCSALFFFFNFLYTVRIITFLTGGDERHVR